MSVFKEKELNDCGVYFQRKSWTNKEHFILFANVISLLWSLFFNSPLKHILH
jgi:hypothetical protein